MVKYTAVPNSPMKQIAVTIARINFTTRAIPPIIPMNISMNTRNAPTESIAFVALLLFFIYHSRQNIVLIYYVG